MKKLLLTTALVFALPIAAQASHEEKPSDQTSKPAAPAMPALKMLEPSALPAGVYKSDQGHTSLTWQVKHMGLSNYLGQFYKVDATVTFDPKDITKSSVTATVDLASVATPSDVLTKLLLKDKWFNTEKFPQATFKSTKIEKTGKDKGIIYGDLTFMGITKPIKLDAVFIGGLESRPGNKVPAMGISATTKLKRNEWGIKEIPLTLLGDDVIVHFESEVFLQK
jgi:polyisoprenoid-binding protein YceI